MKITASAFFLSAFLALAMTPFLAAQAAPYSNVSGEIIGTFHYFTTDELGNVYAIDDDFEIIKYTAAGKETYRYSNTRLDRPTFIDATDPFNIMVFYPDYQTIILLDRTMTETANLNLSDFDFFNVNAVALSGDNKLWVYDELNFRLKKINRNGEAIQTSDDFSLFLKEDFKPNYITEREQTVFVNDPEIGILVFDAFGQYMKTIDFKGLDEFQIFRNLLIFRDAEGLQQTFHLKSLLTQSQKLPEHLPKGKIRYQTGLLYAQGEKGITIIKL